MKFLLRFFVAAFACYASLSNSPLKAQAMPDFWWQCDEGDTTYNFHPATNMDSAGALVFDSLPCAPSYTMIVVYRPFTDTVESAVWRLEYNDSVYRGLTTRRILIDASEITYTDTTQPGPIINTLRQSVADIDTAQRYCRLVLGGFDTVESHIKVSEVLYYSRKLGVAELRKVQTYLAVKYGVTLEPVDYVSSTGDTVWRIEDNAAYHNRITGLGQDTVYGLLQTQSRSEVDGAVITLASGQMPQNGYLLTGDDNGRLEFIDEGLFEKLGRNWRIVGKNMPEQALFSIRVDLAALPGDCDSLVLLLDGSTVYPDSISDGMAWYNNLQWPGYDMTYTFGRGTVLWEETVASKGGTRTHTGDLTPNQGTEQTVSVYPNPSNGHYHIQAAGCETVNVTIYNTHGAVVAQFSDHDKTQYHFDGELPSGNVYYVTITTPEGTQTTKLSVR